MAFLVLADNFSAQAPPAVNGSAVAFDSDRKQLVAFGGVSQIVRGPVNLRSNTWKREGNVWVDMPLTFRPQARSGHSMAYDLSSRRHIMFGGHDGSSYLADTWAFDGTAWTLLPSNGPAGRRGHRLVYDVERGRIVMFGGSSAAGLLDDTWELNGNSWTLLNLSPSPAPRAGHSMAYDTWRKRVVLFGGSIGSSLSSDIWELSSSGWVNTFPNQPYRTGPGPTWRSGAGMVFDEDRGRCVIFGGLRQGGGEWSYFQADVWEWDGASWTNATIGQGQYGGGDWSNSCAYDALERDIVVVGSQDRDGWYDYFSRDGVWRMRDRIWRKEPLTFRSPVTGNVFGLTEALTFAEAMRRAVVEGAELAEVANAAESQWAGSSFLAGTGLAWIGLTDQAQEGEWRWINGSSNLLRRWASGEPNGGSGENHVVITSAGFWADVSSAGSRPALLRYPGAPTWMAEHRFITSGLPTGGLSGHTATELNNQTILVFGGRTSQALSGNTYAFDGISLTQLWPNLQPTARELHSMVNLGSLQQALLFGGKNPVGMVLGDTWTWGNNQWSYMSTWNAPPARYGHRLVFDQANGRGLLFGGEDANGNVLGDFWGWNGSSWTQLALPRLPPPRSHFGLDWDLHRSKLFLYGGKSGSSELDDFWVWDGSGWDEVSAALQPQSRHAATMAWDPVSARMILFGGKAGVVQGDTWHLTAVSGSPYGESIWSNVQPSVAPIPRSGAAAAFDLLRGRFIIFGGDSGQMKLGDTWLYDGTSWSQAAVSAAPVPVDGAVMVFDSARGRCVLFGGSDASGVLHNETWEWDGSNWQQALPASQPSARTLHAMAYDSQRQRVVLYGGKDSSSAFLGDTWEFDGVNWVQVSGSGPSARAGSAFCYDSVRGQSVLVGGHDASGILQQTWIWNGSAWIQAAPMRHPLGLNQPVVAFDSVRGKVLFFGGASAGWLTNFGDSWEWDGSQWSRVLLPRSDGPWNPGPRKGHTLSYDRRLQAVVVHGGTRGGSALGDMWAWDGGAWSRLSSPSPQMIPRHSASAIFSTAMNGTLIMGGQDGGAIHSDIWATFASVAATGADYGQGCAGLYGLPRLNVRAGHEALLGRTLICDLTNVPTTNFNLAFGLYDLQRTSFVGQAIPVHLDFAGLPSCYAWTGGGWSVTLPPMQAGTGTSLRVPIPYASGLLGASIFLQALIFDNSNGRWASVSNAVEARVGNR